MNQTEKRLHSVVIADPNVYERHRLAHVMQKNGFIVLLMDERPSPDVSATAVILAESIAKVEDMPGWNHPRLIIIGDNPDHLVAYLEAGADDFLIRPFSPRLLVAHLKALLRRSA